MKKIVSLLILFISISIFAQNPKIGVITGKVVDISTQEELPYVSIVIKNAENKILTGGMTKGYLKSNKFQQEKIVLKYSLSVIKVYQKKLFFLVNPLNIIWEQ